MEDRLRGDLIRRKLGLQMRAVVVKAGDDSENDRGSEHQPSEKRKVFVGTKLVPGSTQDPFIDQGDEKFARGDREKPQGHDRALHRIRRLRISKFQSSD